MTTILLVGFRRTDSGYIYILSNLHMPLQRFVRSILSLYYLTLTEERVENIMKCVIKIV